MKGSEVMKKLSVLWLLLLLVGCGNASSSLEGEWLGTDKNGGGGRVTFNEDHSVLVEMGLLNTSYQWDVEDDILLLKRNDKVAYKYKINQQNKDNITLQELDEEGKVGEGNDIQLNRKHK